MLPLILLHQKSGTPFGLSLTIVTLASLLITGHGVIIAMTPGTSPIRHRNRLRAQCTKAEN